METLIDYARGEGIRELSGEVLAENSAMLRMCDELGFHVSKSPHDANVRIVTLLIDPVAR